MLALGLARPEALAAEANVARFEATGRVDLVYLGSLSADAVPGVVTLPRAQRCEALQIMADEAAGRSAERSVGLLVAADPWFAANVSRSAARPLVAAERC
jgi:predicted pyridoxine 5'-phosphate oxidase superfamily flavin-nucleotide-binding protein